MESGVGFKVVEEKDFKEASLKSHRKTVDWFTLSLIDLADKKLDHLDREHLLDEAVVDHLNV